jgi:hypothetical protein
MASGIYLIRIGGTKYVGQSVNIDRRWEQHLLDLECGEHHNTHLQKLYDRGHRPKFSVLILCPRVQLSPLEALWGRIYSNCPQRLPALSIWSFLPAFHHRTLNDFAMYGVLAVVVKLLFF